jgi:apoptotic chromatin condensation inducer in the nucleus
MCSDGQTASDAQADTRPVCNGSCSSGCKRSQPQPRRRGCRELQGFWIDSLKSHCYVVFATVDQASATFRAVDQKDWPPRCKSCMQPAYVTLAEAETMITSRGHAVVKRVRSAAGEAPRSGSGGGATASGSNAREASADAPEARRVRTVERTERAQDEEMVDLTGGETSGDRARSAPPPAPAAAPLIALFNKTKTAPQIFWLPLSGAEVEQATGAKLGANAGVQAQSKDVDAANGTASASPMEA